MNHIPSSLLFVIIILITNSKVCLSQHLYTKGVVVMRQDFELEHPITIYDTNGKPFRKFVFMDEFDRNPSIHHFRCSAEYSILIFNCLAINDKYYKVVTDEKKRQVGYIPRSDKKFCYETWGDHVASVSSVDFDPEDNPLHKQPNEPSPLVPVSSKIDLYRPEKAIGDWLKVSWESPKKGVGWIKWKDKHSDLIVELFYFI